MGTRGHPPGAAPPDADRAATAAVTGRASRRHAAGPPDASAADVGTSPVRVELPALVAAPAEALWRLLSDPVAPVHLGVDGVVLAFAVPGLPEHGVGAQACVVRRVGGGFVTELSEVVEVDPGRGARLRWLSSAPRFFCGFAVEPRGPLAAEVLLWAEAEVPAGAAAPVAADLQLAATRAVWELRDVVGDPAVAGTTPPPPSAALLQQLGQPRPRNGAGTLDLREPHAVRREVDVAAPIEVVWRLLVGTDTPVAHPYDPQARRFAVPGTPVQRAGALVGTTTRRRDGSVQVDLDEIVDLVEPTDVTVASFASAEPRAMMIHVTAHDGGCRVEAEMAHDRCTLGAQACAATSGARVDHYLERVRRHAVGEPDLAPPR